MRSLLLPLLSSLLGVTLMSCEDPEMAKKNREQERQISALQAELEMQKEKLDEDFVEAPDESLEEVELQITNIKEKVSASEDELKSLIELEEKVEKNFSSYKKTYPMSP